MTSEGMAQLIAEVGSQDCSEISDTWVVLASERSMISLCILQAGDRNADLVFCIGGPFGHSNDLRAQANKVVKLSDMVMNHQVQFYYLMQHFLAVDTSISS